jgi:hypothetical protein
MHPIACDEFDMTHLTRALSYMIFIKNRDFISCSEHFIKLGAAAEAAGKRVPVELSRQIR